MCMLINALLLFVACCLLVCGALCSGVGRSVSLIWRKMRIKLLVRIEKISNFAA